MFAQFAPPVDDLRRPQPAEHPRVLVLRPHHLPDRFSYRSFAQLHAALLLPYAPFQTWFVELYAVGVPIWVPEPKVLSAFTGKCYSYCPEFQGPGAFFFSQTREEVVERLLDELGDGSGGAKGASPGPRRSETRRPLPPYDPALPVYKHAQFRKGRLTTQDYWAQFAVYLEFPYVNFFSSFADLAAQMARFTDFEAGQGVVEKLRERGERQRLWHWKHTVEPTAGKYRAALRWLFGRGQAAGGGGGEPPSPPPAAAVSTVENVL